MQTNLVDRKSGKDEFIKYLYLKQIPIQNTWASFTSCILAKRICLSQFKEIFVSRMNMFLEECLGW